jgi:hypothetical protein
MDQRRCCRLRSARQLRSERPASQGRREPERTPGGSDPLLARSAHAIYKRLGLLRYYQPTLLLPISLHINVYGSQLANSILEHKPRPRYEYSENYCRNYNEI